MRFDKDHKPAFSTIARPDGQTVAVAIQGDESAPDSRATIVASGRGKLADEILQIAFSNGIKVREDCDLAQLLVQLEIDTPIPSEAIVIVAEILAKVYEANEAASRP